LNKRQIGGQYETLAAKYLEQQGLRILCTNYRVRYGEIDLIAEESTPFGETIVFVEVKYRTNADKGYPWQSVTLKKQRTICRVADFYRMKNQGLNGYMIRFDIISILGDQISWYPNAFSYRK